MISFSTTRALYLLLVDEALKVETVQCLLNSKCKSPLRMIAGFCCYYLVAFRFHFISIAFDVISALCMLYTKLIMNYL